MRKRQLSTKGNKNFLLILIATVAISLLLIGCGLGRSRPIQGSKWTAIGGFKAVDEYCTSIGGVRGDGRPWTGCVSWADRTIACSTVASCQHEALHAVDPAWVHPSPMMMGNGPEGEAKSD